MSAWDLIDTYNIWVSLFSLYIKTISQWFFGSDWSLKKINKFICNFVFQLTDCSSQCECKEEGCHTVSNGQDCFYHFTKTSVTWTEAQKFCKDKEMIGGMIRDPKTSELFKENRIDNAWLAAKAHSLDKWTFVNGNDASKLICKFSFSYFLIHFWKHDHLISFGHEHITHYPDFI